MYKYKCLIYGNINNVYGQINLHRHISIVNGRIIFKWTDNFTHRHISIVNGQIIFKWTDNFTHRHISIVNGQIILHIDTLAL